VPWADPFGFCIGSVAWIRGLPECFSALIVTFLAHQALPWGCPIEPVYLYREPIDFRKAIDGLSVLVEQDLGLSPFASALYVFTNRHRNKIKALYWHRNGFCLLQKRLERDKFAWPREDQQDTQTISLQEFGWLLEGFDLWRNKPHKTLNFLAVS
jgi:transposase